MPSKKTTHPNYWIPFFSFLLLIIGLIGGFFIAQKITVKKPITTVIERNDRLEELINLISEKYVDSIETDSLYTDAINGILKHLDPYTTYLPIAEAEEATARLKGEYRGIGIEFMQIDDTMMVSKVIVNSPAEESGFQFGDRIVAIDTSTVAGPHKSNKSLREIIASKGEYVDFSIIRLGESNLKKLELKQGTVPRYAILGAFMVTKDIGYIKIESFSANTYREFIKELEALKESGMKKLVLDLRDNSGGYIDAATAIANEFLTDKKLMVYTQSRAFDKQEYFSDDKGLFKEGALTVLINSQTGSAAEIVAGAIQDWDRGVLIGETSYGKALIQNQYELRDGSIIRLTIGKYFTPSGRSIQVPFKKLHNKAEANSSDDDYIGEKVYFSMKNKRPLKSNTGGISPDIFIETESSLFYENVIKSIAEKTTEKIAFDYLMHHPKETILVSKAKEEIKNIKIPEIYLQKLRVKMFKTHPVLTEEIWKNPFALDYINFQLKSKIILLTQGNNEYYQFIKNKDNDFSKAEAILNSDYQYRRILGS